MKISAIMILVLFFLHWRAGRRPASLRPSRSLPVTWERTGNSYFMPEPNPKARWYGTPRWPEDLTKR